MAKDKKDDIKEKKRKMKEEDESPLLSLKQETKMSVIGIVLFVLGFFFLLSSMGKAGIAGTAIFHLFQSLVGIGYFLIPVGLLVFGYSMARHARLSFSTIQIVSAVLFFLATLGLVHISIPHAAGFVGQGVAWPFLTFFDIYASILILGALLIVSLIVVFDEHPKLIPLLEKIKNVFQKKKIDEMDVLITGSDHEDGTSDEQISTTEIPPTQEEEITEESTPVNEEEIDIPETISKPRPVFSSIPYVPPPLSLLEHDRGKANVGDIKANANIIKRTLLNFGIEVEMDEVTVGPTITRYALKPAVGVKLSRIVGLQNDMAMALAAHPIRIEAPIPGKSLVGIEIPNKTKSIVGLGTLLADPAFQKADKALAVAVGRDIAGVAHVKNLARMPHALIAGTTGSGKSVSIHGIITSLLYRNGPENLKFIFVDPKRVELTLYNKIPHLLTPVITDAKKCIQALKWAAKEMDRRYDILQSESVRDIESYHKTIVDTWKGKDETTRPDPLPYIVIMIDELADIMQAYPRELEAAIVRLAQMSRAVGIHLILSTQRPEVNVITGLIKANVPTRLAFRVPTQVDSRTILDTAGAEKLLGSGDMLYADGDGQPKRLQGAFIGENEVKAVVKYLVDAYRDQLPDHIDFGGSISADSSLFESQVSDDEDDDLYEEARSIVIEHQKASTSFLQRKLGIGYARAARLIDILEERGIVGAGNGSKPRDILEKSMDSERIETNQ